MYLVEAGFELDFDGIKVNGFIDLILENRVTGELRVRDIKTALRCRYAVAQRAAPACRPASRRVPIHPA